MRTLRLIAIGLISIILLFDAAMLSMPEAWTQPITQALVEWTTGWHFDYAPPQPWNPLTLLWTMGAIGLELTAGRIGLRLASGPPAEDRRALWIRLALLGCGLGLLFHLRHIDLQVPWWWLSYYTLHPVILFWLGLGLLRAGAAAFAGHLVLRLRGTEQANAGRANAVE